MRNIGEEILCKVWSDGWLPLSIVVSVIISGVVSFIFDAWYTGKSDMEDGSVTYIGAAIGTVAAVAFIQFMTKRVQMDDKGNLS